MRDYVNVTAIYGVETKLWIYGYLILGKRSQASFYGKHGLDGSFLLGLEYM